MRWWSGLGRGLRRRWRFFEGGVEDLLGNRNWELGLGLGLRLGRDKVLVLRIG